MSKWLDWVDFKTDEEPADLPACRCGEPMQFIERVGGKHEDGREWKYRLVSCPRGQIGHSFSYKTDWAAAAGRIV